MLTEGLRLAAQAPRLFDLETLLQDTPAEPVQTTQLISAALTFFSNKRPAAAAAGADGSMRLPQTPCIKQDLELGMRTLFSMFFAPAEDARPALDSIREATQKHPEALLPLTAAMLLESRRPTDPEKLRRCLAVETEFLEMAVAMPSVLPNVSRTARFLAALGELELAHRLTPPSLEARQLCLKNLQHFAHSQNSSAAVCKASFNLAFEIGELDLARQILSQWESVSPDPASTLRYRIPLELAQEAIGRALPLIDGLLAIDPQDAWALRKREAALRGIQKWLHSSEAPALPPESELNRKQP